MASNQIPNSYDPLVELMEDAADGAATHGVAIGLKQNTEANIRTDLEALIGKPAGPGGAPAAVPGLKALLNLAKTTKTEKTAALRTACSNGRTLAMTCIGALKPVLGQQWNSAWNAAGFTDGSLAVETNPMIRLQQLRAYYAANPAREVPNINGIACTAAACETAAQTISTAQSESNQSNTDAGTAQASLEAGIATARRRMTGLREELAQLLGDGDERWYAFGFDKPSDPSTPEVPENLTVTPGAPGSGTLFLHCDTARRADSYRFTVTNAVGGAKITAQISAEPELVVSGLPAPANVNVTVSARNTAGGESANSAPVAASVP
jgi:hypothetical protein